MGSAHCILIVVYCGNQRTVQYIDGSVLWKHRLHRPYIVDVRSVSLIAVVFGKTVDSNILDNVLMFGFV